MLDKAGPSDKFRAISVSLEVWLLRTRRYASIFALGTFAKTRKNLGAPPLERFRSFILDVDVRYVFDWRMNSELPLIGFLPVLHYSCFACYGHTAFAKVVALGESLLYFGLTGTVWQARPLRTLIVSDPNN